MKRSELSVAQNLQYSFMRASDSAAGIATGAGLGYLATGSKELGASAVLAVAFSVLYWAIQNWAKINIPSGK